MKKIILSFMLTYSFTYHEISYSQPSFTRGAYNIEISSRMDTPYPALPNYTPDLTQSGTGAQYTVPVSRHHIIPFDTLRTFYNNLVARGDLFQLRGFLGEFAGRIPDYAGFGGIDCTARTSDFQSAAAIAVGISGGSIRPGGTTIPEGFDTFNEFYIWMPWNLFIGPSNRDDDPGSALDQGARYIINDDRTYSMINEVYNLMLDYNRQDPGIRLDRIGSLLRTLSRTVTMYPLEADQWIRSSTDSYRIRRTDNQKRSTTPSEVHKKNITTTNDTCTAIRIYYTSILVNF